MHIQKGTNQDELINNTWTYTDLPLGWSLDVPPAVNSLSLQGLSGYLSRFYDALRAAQLKVTNCGEQGFYEAGKICWETTKCYWLVLVEVKDHWSHFGNQHGAFLKDLQHQALGWTIAVIFDQRLSFITTGSPPGGPGVLVIGCSGYSFYSICWTLPTKSCLINAFDLNSTWCFNFFCLIIKQWIINLCCIMNGGFYVKRTADFIVLCRNLNTHTVVVAVPRGPWTQGLKAEERGNIDVTLKKYTGVFTVGQVVWSNYQY